MRDFVDSSTPDPVVSTIALPDGGERVVWRHGVGRPLLLIQGMSGTHDHWGDVLVEGLTAAGRSLVGINHRGVYRTAAPEPGYSIADLADDQAAALDALGVTEPIDVYGISMGGMTAIEFVLRHPEKVRTLALGCTTAGGAAMTPPSQEDMMGLFGAQQSGDRELAMRAGFEMNLSEGYWTNDEAFARFVELTERAPVPVSVILGQLQAIGSHDTAARLHEISVPTTILHGTEDRLLPYPNHAPMLENIPGATLETFEGAGHLHFWEDPERVVQILEDLSARSSADSPSAVA
ncbi:MAG: alpha/beta hydrolase [Solirubrobacteraceae bacterium]|nr:alpha/beta hydrolase [Solirubrobacteraceae bacterium]